MPSYPSTFDAPNASGFSLGKKKFKEEITTEMGFKRRRRVVSNNFYVLSLQFSFKSKSEFDEFLKWIKYDINYGNLWFNANWLSDIGFTAGQWVFRFVSIPFSATGYSMGIGCTVLMAPKNNNVVNSNYTEIGVASDYIDQEYPFGYEEFECEDFDYYRIYGLDDNLYLFTSDWNGYNWTLIGNKLDVASLGADYVEASRAIACTKENYVAIVTGIIGSHAKLRMFYFDGISWSDISTVFTLTGYSVVHVRIARLSDSRIVLHDEFSQKLDVYEYNYSTNAWSKIGSSTNTNSYITPYTSGNSQNAFVAVSSTRVVFLAGGNRKFIVLDFNGTSFSQVGSSYTLPSVAVGILNFSSMSLYGANKIAFNDQGSPSIYKNKISTFVFDPNAITFSAGSQSDNARIGANYQSIAGIGDDTLAWSCTTGSGLGLLGCEFSVSKFVEKGNQSVVEQGFYSYSITSPYKAF